MSHKGYEVLPLGGAASHARSQSSASFGRRLRGSSLRSKAVILALVVGGFLLLRGDTSPAKVESEAVAYTTPLAEIMEMEVPAAFEDDRAGELAAVPEQDPIWVPEPAQPVDFIEEPTFPSPQPCNAPTSYEDTAGQVWLSPSPPLLPRASLVERLADWRAAPVANQSVWLEFNSQTCTMSSPDHRERERKTWSQINATRVVELREGLITNLERAAKAGNLTVPAASKGTRGLVFTGGNADTISRVVTSLKLLRHFGTTLPAEVFHFPSNEEPISDGDIEKLAQLNATVREVRGLTKQADSDRSKSFHLKGAAMVQSSFEQILMLDSDNLPCADVEPLFDAPGYTQAGAMLWPDFWREDGANAVWAILGVQCRDEWTTEAGQVLIDKSRHLDALWLVQTMLQDWKFWFDISDGDKDLFRYALLMLRKRWAVPGRHVASASWSSDDEIRQRKGFCGHTMIQHDHEGEPLFVHANLLKRILGDFGPGGNTWARTRQLALPMFPPPGPAGAAGAEAPAKAQVEEGVRYDHELGMWKNRKGEGKWRGPPPWQDRKPMRVKPAEVEEEEAIEEAEAMEVAREEEDEVDLDALVDLEEDEADMGRALVPEVVEVEAGGNPVSTIDDDEDENGAEEAATAAPVRDNDFTLRRRQLLNPLSAITSFPTMADHLANPLHPSGLGLLAAPRHVRLRALLEPRLAPDFWSGHRASNFVLCVDSALERAAPALTDDDQEMCGLPEWAEGEAAGGMEVVWWRDVERLKGFEALFYEVGGRPNGVGF